MQCAALLIERGADVDHRETSYSSTPLGAARWWQQPEMVELLGKHSRDVWALANTGRVERLREILWDDPAGENGREQAQTLSADGEAPVAGGPIRKTAWLVVAVLASNAAVPSGEQQRIGIERIAWLQGCWEMVSPEGTIEEQWMAPRGKSMLGMSRTVRGDSLVGYEVVVVREHGDQLAYQAHPSGQPAAIFLSRTVTDSMVLFENAEHDFPQRIGYRRDRSDALVAWIEGTSQGQARRADFTYRRTMCPGRTGPRP